MTLLFQVKVVPSSGRVAWLLDKQQRLKLFIKSPPEQGRANQEVIQHLSQALKIPRNAIQIVSGSKSRIKTIKVPLQLTMQQLWQKLGIEIQQSLPLS